jgi:hypothetical protein
MPQAHLCVRPFSNCPPGQGQTAKIAARKNSRTRALTATVLYWQTSLCADETARVKRDLSRQKHSRETETLDAKSRLVCNTVEREQTVEEVRGCW